MQTEENEQGTERLNELVANLQHTDCFDHSVERFEQVETHISIVLLTGPFAYKFKKPLDLEFLDFSTLDRRREACRTELQLNRRTAPELYVDVVTITGSVEDPVLDGEGAPIEYAVKMKEFPQEARMDNVVERGAVTDDMIDRTADEVSDLHLKSDVVELDRGMSEAEHQREELDQTYEQLTELLEQLSVSTETADRVYDWGKRFLEDHGAHFDNRAQEGRIHDLHGDLHLQNIAWFDDRPVFYDCIEFNDAYRHIDPINELAFLTMDLERIGTRAHSWRLTNRYLEKTGDYTGVQMLPYFKAYRAMVRAMVAGIKHVGSRCEQEDVAVSDRMTSYLQQMDAPLSRGPSVLVLMYGVSASGKTTISQQLLQRLGGIRVRSDVERRRIHDLNPMESEVSSYDVEEGLYSEESTHRTYERLQLVADDLLDSGYPVFVDATFLDRTHRKWFHELAERREVPIRIVHPEAPEEELRRRIRERTRAEEPILTDADEQVLNHQLESGDELTSEEQNITISVTPGAGSVDQVVERIRNCGRAES